MKRFFVIFTILAGPLSAGVLFTDLNGGAFQDTFPAYGLSSSGYLEQQLAAPFQLAETGILDSVDLAVTGIPNCGCGSSFTIQITQDADGIPGTTLEAMNLNAGTAVVLSTVDSILHPTLTAGTKYWLVVLPSDSAGNWYWNIAGYGGLDYSFDGGSNWIESQSIAPTFQINGTIASVPETSSALLLVSGMGAIAVMRRYWTRNKRIVPPNLAERR